MAEPIRNLHLHVGGPMDGQYAPRNFMYELYTLATSDTTGINICVHKNITLHVALAILLNTYNVFKKGESNAS